MSPISIGRITIVASLVAELLLMVACLGSLRGMDALALTVSLQYLLPIAALLLTPAWFLLPRIVRTVRTRRRRRSYWLATTPPLVAMIGVGILVGEQPDALWFPLLAFGPTVIMLTCWFIAPPTPPNALPTAAVPTPVDER
jgi:hypothetical protein